MTSVPINDQASTLLDAARAWLAEDPDPQTRAELEAAVAEVE
jgi:phosphomannomutase